MQYTLTLRIGGSNMKKFFCLFLVLSMMCSAALAEVGLLDFSTTDMDGNVVTQEIFSDYDLTVVNVWATWCGYCIEEMPDLARLKTMLPENVNFITLCEDAHLDMDLAREILDASGANYQTLILNQQIYNDFFYLVESFPTTFFLDNRGAITSMPVIGVMDLNNPAQAYYDYTMNVLNTIKKRS